MSACYLPRRPAQGHCELAEGTENASTVGTFTSDFGGFDAAAFVSHKARPAFTSGPGIFLRRPVLGAYVTEVISLWSHAEANFGILASCLHADSAVGLRMYLCISGSEARRAALYAAAGHSLSEGNFALFDRVMRAVNHVRKCRNDFAHGLWTISDELPDALLWDPAETRALIWECNVKQQAVPIFAETMVYSRSDLIRDARDAQQAAGAVHSLSVLFDPRYQNQYQKRLKVLLASPLVVRLSPVEGLGNVPSTTPATGSSGG